jgi:O-acetyl-ADP-ribose deacetylase (regulator of RNase III)
MAMERRFDELTLVVTCGDIAAQDDVDAVVNAANAQLRPGGGVAGAIHRGAGPDLDRECRALAPIRPGEAVCTSAHDLPNRYVIHCLGPIYGQDKPSDQLLANCYRKALTLAEEKQVESLAFPSISTGVFGYPMQDAARIALRTVREEAPSLRSVKRVKFVLFGEEALQIHEQELARVNAGD